MKTRRLLLILLTVFALAGGVSLASLSRVSAASSEAGGVTSACKQDPNNPYCLSQKQDNSTDPISKTIKNVTTIVATIGGLLAVLFVIYGGYTYIISRGNPTKTGNALKIIIYALSGLIVIAIAQFIIIFLLDHVIT